MLIVKIWKYIESLLYLNNLKGFFLLGNAFFLEATHRLVYAFLNCFSHLLNLKVKNKRKNTKLLHLLSCVRLFVTPWTVACQASLSFTNSQSLLKLMSIKLVMPSNHLILCQPLLLLPSIFPKIRVFTNESTLCIRWPKYRSFSFSICPSNEYSGLISFRMDWLDLLAAQGTLKSILQQHSSKASILQWSAFLIVQLSHPYMSTGKTIALTRRTFVSKVMSLVFNMLSRLVLAFLPGSKCLLISWLQSPSEVILELPQIKSITVSIVSPSICYELMGLDAMILVFWMLWSEVKLLSHVLLFATPWTVAYQAPQSMDIFQARVPQWVPFPPPWDLPDPGIEPGSPALQADALLSEPPGKPLCMLSFKPTFSLSSFYLV